MRVLWTTNIVLPFVARDFGLEPTPFGGWLQSLLVGLSLEPGLHLGIAMRADVKAYQKLVRENVTFYVFPSTAANRYDIDQDVCAKILDDFRPDVMHAHGSEMASTARFMKTWSGPKILSLQGVLSGIRPMLNGGGTLEIKSIADIVMLAIMAAKAKLLFSPRISAEVTCLMSADIVLGRTAWDRAHSIFMNPKIQYMLCGEILRAEFFDTQWTLEKAQSFSIFMGNCSVPLKGAHIALKALYLLKKKYPAIRLKVAGPPISAGRLPDKFMYAGHLQRLIASLQLEGNIDFLGTLSPDQMAFEMSRAHVYLLPSLIENSPNTLGEAMLLGVPSVCAFVGGVPSIASHENEALFYPATEPVMLAAQVERLFDSERLCAELSMKARARAMTDHDKSAILRSVIGAYRDLAGMNKVFA